MKSFLSRNVRPIIWIITVLAVLGAVWYFLASAEPKLETYAVAQGNVSGALDEPGTVAADNNANIAFQESGQIAHVYIQDGRTVSAGTTLVELNTSSFQANVNQAQAALAGAQAKLQGLQIGATPQSIAVSQTAVVSADQSLANIYAGIPNTVNDAYAKANDAVRTQLAAFFSSPETNNPQLTFSINNSQILNNIQSARLDASTNLNEWQNELTNVNANSGTSTLSAALRKASSNLGNIQNLMNLALTALTDETTPPPSSAAAYKTSAAAGLNEVNVAITEVTNTAQAIASQSAAIQQAEAALNLTTASSTAQEIAEQEAAVEQARANLNAAEISLSNASLIAPFSGTVQNVTAQVGQVVSPGETVLSIVNNGGLKIQIYVSETDIAKVKTGDAAAITLDAFGNGTTFPALVTAINSAETTVNGTPSYLVTLHFANAEPHVKDGMTGNVHLILAEETSTVAIPSRLILNDGDQNYVLVKTASGIVRQPVTIGLVGDDGMTEIASGVTPGETLINF